MAVQRRPDAEPTSTLDAALAAGKRGWRVHPLYEPVLDGFCSCGDPGCESVGKHPRLSGWPQKATTDPDRIRELWEKWPTANIGIATGPGSGLVVLDVDPRDGGDESLAELEREHGPLPETYRVGTGGGGEHYYFACDDAEIRNLSGTLGPGLDLRGEGGYVIGAGSLHAVGRAYEVDDDVEATPLAGTRLEAKIREASACSNGNGHSPNVSIVLDRSAKAPAEKLEVLIENDDRFRSTWRRTRKQPGWTPSEWDMSIASRLANAGWSDQEICDGMVEHRRSHGGKDHPSAYYERTIANARDGREASERGAPPKYDRDTGEQLSPLDELNRQTDDVEFLEAKQIGRQKARWYFTVRNRETGEPEPLDPLTTAQIFDASLSKLANRIREARGGRLPTPRKNSSEWVALTDALIAASPREDHGATDGGAWRRRLAAYLEKTWSVEPHRLDPNDPDGKRDAIFEACPFEDPDGRLWVHVGTWLEFLETRRMDADEAAVRSALKHLGFEPQQLTAKVEGENRSRRYWRSPVGFDWRFEE